MQIKQFESQPTTKQLEKFSDDAFIAKCKNKLGEQVWAVIDFKESKNGNEIKA
jgi:hypothetical protein